MRCPTVGDLISGIIGGLIIGFFIGIAFFGHIVAKHNYTEVNPKLEKANEVCESHGGIETFNLELNMFYCKNDNVEFYYEGDN
ncbi:MAG: hypothetical protein ACOC44_16480 [Promethearchaeia archaeon]